MELEKYGCFDSRFRRILERGVSYKVDIGDDFKVPRQPEASEEFESVLVIQCRPESVLVWFGPIEPRAIRKQRSWKHLLRHEKSLLVNEHSNGL